MVAAISQRLKPSAFAFASQVARIRRPTPRRVKSGLVYIARTRAGSVAGSTSAASRPAEWSPPNRVARRLQPPHPAIAPSASTT